MNEFTDYLKREEYSKGTIKTIKTVVGLFNKWLEKENLEAESVRYQDILLYMKSLNRKRVSQRTVQHYLGSIKHYYNYQIEQERIETNPVEHIEVKGVKRRTLYHILQPHELNGLYHKHQDQSHHGKRDKIMLGLLCYQGLQTAELSKLETSHIKLREGQIEVPGGRRSNGRTIQLEPHQVLDIYDYLRQVRPEILSMSQQETNALFVSTEGGENQTNYVSRLFRYLRTINPQIKNAKQVRASVIVKWLKQHNLRKAQYLPGHRYISSTENFRQNDVEGLKEEINQYHPLG